MKNDKRTLALIVMAPILIMSLLYLLLGESTYVPKVAVNESFPSLLFQALEKQDLEMEKVADDSDVDDLLINSDFDAYLSVSPEGILIGCWRQAG
jgi:ABC-2 type transport system permease protein